MSRLLRTQPGPTPRPSPIPRWASRSRSPGSQYASRRFLDRDRWEYPPLLDIIRSSGRSVLVRLGSVGHRWRRGEFGGKSRGPVEHFVGLSCLVRDLSDYERDVLLADDATLTPVAAASSHAAASSLALTRTDHFTAVDPVPASRSIPRCQTTVVGSLMCDYEMADLPDLCPPNLTACHKSEHCRLIYVDMRSPAWQSS